MRAHARACVCVCIYIYIYVCVCVSVYWCQMFIDYNLFGMNFINVDAVKFRRPLPDSSSAVTTINSSSSSSRSGNVSWWFLFTLTPLILELNLSPTLGGLGWSRHNLWYLIRNRPVKWKHACMSTGGLSLLVGDRKVMRSVTNGMLVCYCDDLTGTLHV